MKNPRRWSVAAVFTFMVLALALMGGVAMAQDDVPETPFADGEVPTSMFHRQGKSFGRGHGGPDREAQQENLAEALSITVEELQSARQTAMVASIADAVEQGRITQEQADRILAMHALRNYIEPQEILAEALSMTVEELEAAREDGKRPWELAMDSGLTADELHANAQAALESALQEAVADGVISQEMADELMEGPGLGLFRGHGNRGHGGRHGRPSNPHGFGNGNGARQAPTGFGPDFGA